MFEKYEGKAFESIMTIPKSILFNTIRDAIETRDTGRINDLTDLLYSNFEFNTLSSSHISELSRQIDIQHQEITSSMDLIREGFSAMGKRFDDLIHQMDKRFDETIHQMDKRFDETIHHMDKRFEAVDKRFEASDKRFDDLIHHMDRRFEAVEKRFEASDIRFDDLIHHMDKRFEAVDKRFSVLTWMIGIGFITINTIVVLIKFAG